MYRDFMMLAACSETQVDGEAGSEREGPERCLRACGVHTVCKARSLPLPVSFSPGRLLLCNAVSVSATRQHEPATGVQTSPPVRTPSHPIPATEVDAEQWLGLPESQSKFLSILNTVVYMFLCCSHKSSHPLLPPQCPQACSLLLPCK